MSDLPHTAALTILLLAVALISGAWLTAQNPDIGEQIMTFLKDSILGDALDMSKPVFAAKIFLNNLQACLLMFLGGGTFGILTVIIIATNGFVIGSIIELVRQQHGALYIAAAILPHGIFEIPAFIISGALGFSLALALWKEWYGMDDAANRARSLGRTFILVVLPLVAVAACTEAFITPEIIQLVI